MAEREIVLHGMKLSGHVHRVQLLLEMLRLPYRYVETTRESRAAAEFRAMSAFGQVPVLQDGDITLADSNAILVYLARRYGSAGEWLPLDPVGEANVQRWLSIASGELRSGPCQARLIALFKIDADPKLAAAIAERLFRFMDHHLARGGPFLAADRPTLADLACYAYTARAPEGGIALTPYPALREWLARVEALPRFIPMASSAPRAA